MEKTYFKRKIDAQLKEWFDTKDHSPAVVYGIRQCGKSESIKRFCEKIINMLIRLIFGKRQMPLSLSNNPWK